MIYLEEPSHQLEALLKHQSLEVRLQSHRVKSSDKSLTLVPLNNASHNAVHAVKLKKHQPALPLRQDTSLLVEQLILTKVSLSPSTPMPRNNLLGKARRFLHAPNRTRMVDLETSQMPALLLASEHLLEQLAEGLRL